MKIYVASSWRNLMQQGVVHTLRAAGHEVYDFKHPVPGNEGFRWSEIDPNWQGWEPEKYRESLFHPIAENGFQRDMEALRGCDACVLVLPCGRSAHLEAGFAVGAGKPLFVLIIEPQEPELMYLMAYRDVPGSICTDLSELLGELEKCQITIKLADKMSGDTEWIPVSERLPSDTEEVLCQSQDEDGHNFQMVNSYGMYGGELCWALQGCTEYVVTHWRPLLSSPSREAIEAEAAKLWGEA